MRAEELTGLLERLRLTRDDSELFERALAAMGSALSSYELDLQPVHGDAHLGNVLRTPQGPVWGDFEKACAACHVLGGVGQLAVQAVQKHDFPLVIADVFAIACSFVLVNLLVDLLYGLLDPRIRLA